MIGYKPITLVDIPGQERLRDNIFNKYVGKTFTFSSVRKIISKGDINDLHRNTNSFIPLYLHIKDFLNKIWTFKMY